MTDIDIGYNLDTAGYLAGINAIDAANQRVQSSMGAVTTTSSGLSRALGAITPGRATIAGMGLLAQQAAQAQASLQNLSATSTVTQVNVGKLAGGMRQMARDMPIGGNASRQIVEQFTKMGVASAGSEAKILKLSTSVARLSGATGEGAQGLAQGMVELSRATGNTNLDPKRFEALSDSLTTISAKGGASATGILQFSKAIAPMAQASGIGATGVLGISTAFSRLGEDGLGASTAINKMLSDMNRAVREGSPEMKTYAEMAGKTTEEFKALYKLNPAEALTQVTEAIANAGPGGARQLERIGIEGVRGQRSLQALSASGGLRTQIATAMEGYGSGSTESAAKEAFGGLNDAMTKLSESTEQVAEGLGAPLLGPLTLFTEGLNKATGGLAKLLNSGPIQAILKGGVVAGMGALALKSVIAPIGTYALGRQAVTSGPIGAAIAGWLDKREGANQFGRGARFAQNLRVAESETDPITGKSKLRSGAFGGARGLMYDIFGGLAQNQNRKQGVGAFEDPNAPQRPMGPMTKEEAELDAAASGRRKGSGFSKTRAAASTAHELFGTYMGMTRQQLDNSTQADQLKRDPSWGFTERVKRGWTNAMGATDNSAGPMDAAGKAARAFAETMSEADKTVGKAAKETSASLWGVVKAGGGVVKQAGKDIKAGADIAAEKVGGYANVAGAIGGGLGITALTTLAVAGLERAAGEQAERDDFLNQDMNSTVNALKESMGKATDATSTYGSISMTLQKQLETNAKSQTWADVMKVTDADIAAAATGKVVTPVSGTPAQIAAQVVASAPEGLPADEMAAKKIDIGRQVTRSELEEVMSLIPASFEKGSKGAESAMTTKQLNEMLTTISAQTGTNEINATTELWGFITGGTNPFGGGMAGMERTAGMPDWLKTAYGAKGGATDISAFSEETKKLETAITEGIGNTFKQNATLYGVEYASQERGKQIDVVLNKAIKDNNAQLFLDIAQKEGQLLGGEKMKGKVWNPEDYQGFQSFQDMVAEEDPKLKEALVLQRKKAAEQGGEIKPVLLEQVWTKAIREQSKYLGEVFDVRGTSEASKAMTKSTTAGGEADVVLEHEAINKAVAGAQKLNMSYTELAVQALNSAGAIDATNTSFARLQAILAKAQFNMTATAVATGQSEGQTTVDQQVMNARLAVTPVSDQFTKEESDKAKTAVVNDDKANQDRARARLMAQFNLQVAQDRMREDFERSQDYAKKDYDKQVFRAERNYGIQRERSIYSFNLNQQRAEDDFARSRLRTIRDFNKAAERAQHDYLLARERQMRDFNKNLARQIEDAAKTMYDPYDRIQTKATWDTANLLVNMESQTEAMKKQKEQLDEMRKLGLSAQAIDVLGLGKTENAQQLNNIAADASPEQIAQLNAAAKARAAATGALFLDESNTDLKRSREDLNTAMKDQETDYLESVVRSQEDLAKSLKDSSDDFHRTMKRASADFKLNLRNAEDDLRTSLDDMETDRNEAMTRARTQLGVQLDRMVEDLANADKTITGNMSDMSEALHKAMNGQVVDFSKLLVNNTKVWLTGVESDVAPLIVAAYKSMGITVADVLHPPSASSTAGHSDGSYGSSSHGGGGGIAEGGPVPGWSPHEKADNINARLTAGEFVQPVKTVQHYGAEFMEEVRTRRFPKEKAQHLAEGGMVYKQMEKWVKKNLPGVGITSSYRPGAITALGNVSMHGLGKALDLAPSMNTFNRILGSFGKNIWQLFYAPADGRTILKGNPWRMDGVTKSGHWDHVHWAMQSMQGMAGMSGMSSADFSEVAAALAKMKKGGVPQKALSAKVTKAVMAKLALLAERQGLSPDGGPAYAGEDAVARWTPEVKNVLRMLSRPMSEEGAVLRRIEQESSGNPRAINNWDSNAKRGTPSKGLMQVIDPTFKAYRGRSLPNNIYDPLANIYAGANYAVHRYGSLSAIDPRNKPGGYDGGGYLQPGTTEATNSSGKPEPVLTHKQWADISTLANHVAQMVSADDLRGINAARGAHIVVHNNQSYVYDHSNDFEGAQITVQAQDPDDMAVKIAAKAVTGRITQTRGVRR